MHPTLGRIVLCVIGGPQGETVTRPGIVVGWNEEDAEGGIIAGSINCQVFADGDGRPRLNDGLPNVMWKSNLIHDAEGKQLNTWHWPART